MQIDHVDFNPVSWFVVKNELALSNPEQVAAMFDHIERRVKPQMPHFLRQLLPGHRGRWIDVQSSEQVTMNPIELSPRATKQYGWEEPEVIYTFLGQQVC